MGMNGSNPGIKKMGERVGKATCYVFAYLFSVFGASEIRGGLKVGQAICLTLYLTPSRIATAHTHMPVAGKARLRPSYWPVPSRSNGKVQFFLWFNNRPNNMIKMQMLVTASLDFTIGFKKRYECLGTGLDCYGAEYKRHKSPPNYLFNKHAPNQPILPKQPPTKAPSRSKGDLRLRMRLVELNRLIYIHNKIP